MTKAEFQELFNKSVAGLASQGFVRSAIFYPSGELDTCLYLGPNKTRCAVGWLLPENCASEPDGIDEAIHAAGLDPRDRVDIASAPPYRDTKLVTVLLKLQQAHDFAETPQNMRNRLRTFAEDLSLEVPAVLQELEI